MTNNLNFIPQIFSELHHLVPRYAILNKDSQLLHLHSSHPEDFVSLPQSVLQTLQFFKLKEGDLILLNDPSCSGLGPGDLTWITLCEGLPVAFRTEHPTPWGHTDKRENEGIKIPPTPIRMDGQINTALLEILCTQGALACKYGNFKELIFESIEVANTLSSRLKRIFKIHPQILDKDAQRKYFDLSRKYFINRMLDRFHGEAKIDLPLKTGETLKLKISRDENGLKVDLGGSTASHKLFVPESWTQSAVISFIMAQFNETEIFNHGSFSTINLIKPQQSFISAKGQYALAPAQKLANASLWSAMHLAFFELMPKSFPTLHDYFPTQIQWEVDNKLYDFVLPSGSGSLKDKESCSNYLYNNMMHTDLSVLTLSGCFEIVDLHERKLSSQKNSSQGGSGWSLKLKANTNLRLSWATNNIKLPWKYSRLMSSISPGEIMINNESLTEVIGIQNIKPNDEILLQSGQGCGFLT